MLSRTDMEFQPSRRYAQELFARMWRNQSLARQFLWAGSTFTIGAMLLVGLLVTKLIEETVTRNAAASTALYVDSVIAPLLPDMAKAEMLGDVSRRALDETLSQGALGRRLQTFRLWGPGGQILYSNDAAQIGRRFPPNDALKAAFDGHLTAEFNEIDDVESKAERESGLPLLEIYSPVLQPWSGEVVAVAEFYERADDLEGDLFRVRVQSWSAVAAVTLLFFLGLSTIIKRGSRTITRQSHELRRRIEDLSQLLGQNRALQARIQRASAEAVALNESYLRKLGADLHDGPAQLVAFVAMRIDNGVLLDAETPPERRHEEVCILKSSLDEAMREIRDICTGHVLPHIETTKLPDMLRDLVASYHARSGHSVALRRIDAPDDLPAAAKICIYRFAQEALNNGFKHAGGQGQWLEIEGRGQSITVAVGDAGDGFREGADGMGVGLAGMRSRVESLGGTFGVASGAAGTIVTMTLPLQDMEKTA